MDEKFRMGARDGIERSSAAAAQSPEVTPRLARALLGRALDEAWTVLAPLLGLDGPGPGEGDAQACAGALGEARRTGFFTGGGIPEKDYVAFHALSRFLKPEVYVESGIFIGSSLHAVLSAAPDMEAIGIDPDLTKLRIDPGAHPGLTLIDDRDFGELDPALGGRRALAYFDDHIDAAARILQAHAAGIRTVVLDDAQGLEGMVQRRYPAAPGVPLILAADSFEPGDSVSWTHALPGRPRAGIRGLMREETPAHEACRYVFDADVLARMRTARDRIARWAVMPELGDWVVRTGARGLHDTRKFILVLKD